MKDNYNIQGNEQKSSCKNSLKKFRRILPYSKSLASIVFDIIFLSLSNYSRVIEPIFLTAKSVTEVDIA